MSGASVFDPDLLGTEAEHEIARFRGALELEVGFAFHLIVADSREVLEAAQVRLPHGMWNLRPRPPRRLSSSEAGDYVLAELDRVIESAAGSPVLLDAMVADGDAAWAMVFRRLNELRNGLERRHAGPLIVAVSPAGETSLGREAPDLWSRRGSGMRLRDRREGRPAAAVPGQPWPSPPSEPDAFESLCLDLWREIWADPGALKNGRSGQAQAGVDVFGVHEGRQMGVQCKQKDGLVRTKVTVAELEREVELARGFRPPLATFVLATTGAAGARVQQRAREISEEHRSRSLFKVEVWSWADIWHAIYSRKELLKRLLPIYWPHELAPAKSGRIAPTRLGYVAETLFGRGKELARLDSAWIDPGTHIVTLVAWGGVGKTSLVAKWVAKLATRDFDGADYLDWSFYSQSAGDRGIASSDVFIQAALEFFGDAVTARSAASPWDKGAILARMIAERRTLLVLDGLEPLQHPPGPLAGQLKDPAVSALLKGLAARNPGLCLVTTRQPVADLAPFHETTAPQWRLAQLSTSSGVELLRTLGVHGVEGELVRLVEDVNGHALTLHLLGQYLARAHGGDVRRRDRIRLESADVRTQGGHALRTMETYETWLRLGGPAGARQLAILRLLALFDRPVEAGVLGMLCRGPAIAGLTEPMVDLGEADWDLTIAGLADSGLIRQPAPESASLDAHPLIREHFARRLRKHHPEAWGEAHSRLFEHFRESAEFRPETLEGLGPLYQAVFHGVLAGRQQEAFDDVYRDRILRGLELYSTRTLGAFAADLGAVAGFFERPWDRVSPALTSAAQARLLSIAALDLRALGRLTEAVEPMRAGQRLWIEQGAWQNAAESAKNLSGLVLTLGDVAGALREAKRAVDLADRSGDAFEQLSDRAELADALLQAGRRDDALQRFREAEAMLAKRQPARPLLYSLPGFRYSNLLLAGAERAAWRVGSPEAAAAEGEWSELAQSCREVEQRAAATLTWATEQNWLLDVALDHLTLSRARFYRAVLEGRGPSEHLDGSALNAAASGVEQAVDSLRRAGTLDHLPRGLLTRAWLRALIGDATGARSDLDEAWEIAERGPMPLYLADVCLHCARLFGDRDALAEARRLIEKHGYGRRLEELADAEAAAEAGT